MRSEEDYIRLEADERKITNDEVLIVLKALKGTQTVLKRELMDFYNKYGKDGVVTYAEARKWVSESDHRKRLLVLLSFVATQLDYLGTKINPHLRSLLSDIIGMELDFFNLEPWENLESKILAEHWGVDDDFWEHRLMDDVDLWKAHLFIDIKRNLMKHEGITGMLDALRVRFRQIEFAVKTLFLTESTAIGSMSRYEIFKRLGIDKYQFYTREDERTCDTCRPMHGKIFPVSAYEVGVTASPLHPRCRCWEVPVL